MMKNNQLFAEVSNQESARISGGLFLGKDIDWEKFKNIIDVKKPVITFPIKFPTVGPIRYRPELVELLKKLMPERYRTF